MTPKRPNVLVLMSDDTDPFNLGCFGADEFLTPHLDQLAVEGMRFTRSEVVAPVCTPSRYAYLTGQFPGRCPNAFRENNPVDDLYNITWNTDLAPAQANLATIFRDGDYRTGYVGKFHCGRHSSKIGLEQLPPGHDPHDPAHDAIHRRNQAKMVAELQSYGWEDAVHVTEGNLDFNPWLDLPHNLEWTTQGALDLLDTYAQEEERPFMLYVSYHAIHGPKHGEDLDQLDPRVTPNGVQKEAVTGGHPSRESVLQRLREAGLDPYHRNVGALWLDDGVGAILKRLEELGLAEDTIVIYKADHGKYGKASVYQGGARVPLIWRWPGQVEAGSTNRTIVQNVDFLPTLMEVLGLEAPEGYHLDGKSYAAQLKGDTTPLRKAHYNEFGTTRSVRTERWKYIALRYKRETLSEIESGQLTHLPNHLGRAGLSAEALHHRCYYEADQLYDLQQDRYEQINLAGAPAYAEVLAAMRRYLDGYLGTFEHPYPREADPFQSSEAYRKMALASTADTSSVTEPGSVFGDRFW